MSLVPHLQPINAVSAHGALDDGTRFIIVVQEQPQWIPGFEKRVEKATLERYHLERYRADHLARTGCCPFEEVVSGDNPPDFVVNTPNGPERLDCAAFALQERRVGYRLFALLRQRLLDGASGRDFSGVKGCSVSVWFRNATSMPPKQWDQSLIDPLLDAIAQCTVDRKLLAELADRVSSGGFPPQMPPGLPIGQTQDGGAGFFIQPVSLINAADDAGSATAFDVQLHLSEHLLQPQLLNELQRLVSQHDREAIQHLLITAGGPDRDGVRYPSEEMAAAFALEPVGITLRARHVRRVTVHLWAAAVILEPDVITAPPL